MKQVYGQLKRLRRRIINIYVRISPVGASKLLFYHVHRKRLNLQKPVWFDEYLMKLKLYQYNNNDLVTQCVDKYLVRDYVRKKIGEQILNELYGVWDEVSGINWDTLPNAFVLKCNHGCHYNIICRNKQELDKRVAAKQLNKWLKEKFWLQGAEVNYRHIKPRIICEKYLETLDGGGTLPVDYKFYCFNGKAKVVLVCSGRETDLKFTYFNMNWEVLKIGRKPEDKTIEQPSAFLQMKQYSEVLSEPFPFVRVDLYQIDDKIIFGEMTFTPAACSDSDYTEQGQLFLGDLFLK